MGSTYAGTNAAPADCLLVEGKVGIGTATPDTNLHVAGDFKATGNTTLGVVSLGGFTAEEKDEWPNITWCRNIDRGWDEGLIKHGPSRGFFTRSGFGIHMHSSRDWTIFSTNWDALFGVRGESGDVRIKGEIKSPKWNINQLLSNVPGPLETIPRTTFVSGGGTLLIMVSGSCHAQPGDRLVGLKVMLNGVEIGKAERWCKIDATGAQANHVTCVTNPIVKTGISGGNHEIKLEVCNNSTLTNGNDRFSLTVLELPF